MKLTESILRSLINEEMSEEAQRKLDKPLSKLIAKMDSKEFGQGADAEFIVDKLSNSDSEGWDELSKELKDIKEPKAEVVDRIKHLGKLGKDTDYHARLAASVYSHLHSDSVKESKIRGIVQEAVKEEKIETARKLLDKLSTLGDRQKSIDWWMQEFTREAKRDAKGLGPEVVEQEVSRQLSGLISSLKKVIGRLEKRAAKGDVSKPESQHDKDEQDASDALMKMELGKEPAQVDPWGWGYEDVAPDEPDFSFGPKYNKNAWKSEINESKLNQIVQEEIQAVLEEARHLTSSEKKKKEKIVKGMKKGMKGFKERYGKRAKEVMYATATKQAEKKKK